MYQLSQNASIGATQLYLNGTAGISAGDKIGVMMDTGSYFNTSVVGSPTSDSIVIASALPYPAAENNIVTDYEAAGP